jgi:anhydro-N-acetylmuramic acid kinase
LADALLLDEHDFYLNLGGIANITAKSPNTYIAFDVGGANQILNALVGELDLPYDDKGQIARTGHYIPELAQQQDQLAYFAQSYPKSLGNNWVQEQQTASFLNYDAPLADKLHTACRHIAHQITQHINRVIDQEELAKPAYNMLVSGGGVYNDFLLECIREALPRVVIKIPTDQIIAFKEAALMALMGSLRLLELPNCLASVTGARRNVCGGAVHFVDS